MIEPEQYDETGEIIPKPIPQPIYERKLTGYQQHIIHLTKDLFAGDCSYCQDAAKKQRSHWGDDS